MIRLLIAESQAILREGLKQIISASPDMVVSGETASCPEFLEKAWSTDWDVALLEISLPGRGGLEILDQLKHSQIKRPVLTLGDGSGEHYAVRALKAGAAGYLNKECTPEELLGAIRKVAGGGKYVSPALAEQLASDLTEDSHQLPHEHLSDRELEVFLLIASGKTLTEIAQQLSLSVKTISTYHTRILEKMRLKNNSELIRYACEHHLVEC